MVKTAKQFSWKFQVETQWELLNKKFSWRKPKELFGQEGALGKGELQEGLQDFFFLVKGVT